MADDIPLTGATLAVLELLLSGDGELYGAKIAKAIGRSTGGTFPILARLEQAGWIESAWEIGGAATGRPRRRFYRLRGDGLAAATRAVQGHAKRTNGRMRRPRISRSAADGCL